jgi:hypothetical protein
MSFGHLISGLNPVTRLIARQVAVAAATVSCVVSCGRNCGRNKTENQSPFRTGEVHARPNLPLPFRLRFRENHHAFLHTIARQLFHHIIRRSRLLEDANVAPHHLRFAKPRQQIVRVQHIRRADEPIAQHRTRLDFVAKFTQFLDPRPDGRARDAESLGKFCAGDAAVLRRAERHEDLSVRCHDARRRCNPTPEPTQVPSRVQH